MPGPFGKKPAYVAPEMRGVSALEGPEAGGLDFGALAATALDDASNEIVTYKDRLGRTRESRFVRPPVTGQVSEELYTGAMEDRTDAGVGARMAAERDANSITGTFSGQEELRGGGPADAPMIPDNLSVGGAQKPRGWVDGTGDLNIGQWGTGSPNTQGQMALDPTFAGGLRGAGLGAEVTQGDVFQEGAPPDEGGGAVTPDEGGGAVTGEGNIRQQIKGGAEEPSPGQEVSRFLEEANRPPRGGGADVMEVSEGVTEQGPAVQPPRGWRDPSKSLENVPFEETKHGFSARDYELEGLKNPPTGPGPRQEAGSTGWMRRQYDWARNMPEEMLAEVANNPDLLRYMEGDRGTAANQAPVEEVNVMGTGEIQPIVNDLVEKARMAQEQSWQARLLLRGVDLDRFASGTYSQEDVFRLYELFSEHKDKITAEYPEVWESFMKVVEATR